MAETYSHAVDGATEPEKIPDRVRYGMFVKRYLIDIRNHLIQQLPPNDDVILQALAVRDEQESYAEIRQFQAAMQRLCQTRSIRDPVELARADQRITDEFYANRVRRYKAAFDTLSPAGRKVVDSFIEAAIVPNSHTTLLDKVEWAKQKPEEYLEALRVDCYVAETGQLPPDVQAKVDRA